MLKRFIFPPAKVNIKTSCRSQLSYLGAKWLPIRTLWKSMLIFLNKIFFHIKKVPPNTDSKVHHTPD